MCTLLRTLLATALVPLSLFADEHQAGVTRADEHAPIGVMGDHIHDKGEFMLSYRYMTMRMDGLRDGTDSLSPAEVLQSFAITPLDMTMSMHMFGGMYAPLQDLTLMLMMPVTTLTMDHRTRMGTEFTTESSGVGDIKLSALYRLLELENGQLLLSFGLSLPTGSIDKEDFLPPMGRVATLPYPMQLGSGTVDLMPGITYTATYDKFSWGSQARGTLRLGENGQDYRLGHKVQSTVWGAYRFLDALSGSARVNLERWGDVSGADSRLMLRNMMGVPTVPTAYPNLRSGGRIDFLLGINFIATDGFFKGHRLAIEGGLPIYQNLDGPQLETDWLMTVGWQKAW